jgi:hypothetical protein
MMLLTLGADSADLATLPVNVMHLLQQVPQSILRYVKLVFQAKRCLLECFNTCCRYSFPLGGPAVWPVDAQTLSQDPAAPLTKACDVMSYH